MLFTAGEEIITVYLRDETGFELEGLLTPYLMRLRVMSSDEKITAEELGIVMRALGANPTKQKISEIIKDYDKDGSGKFDQETFLQIMVEYGQEVDSTEDIKKAFEIFDKEKNGYIYIVFIMQKNKLLKTYKNYKNLKT